MSTVLKTFDMKNHCGRPDRKIQLKLESLKEKSAVCSGEEDDPSIPLAAIEWMEDVCAGQADHAVVARHGADVVGFIRWENDEEYTSLRGTYVKPGYRGLGLARAMWDEAIKLFQGSKIDVITTSAGGAGLVESLKKRYGDYEWLHESH